MAKELPYYKFEVLPFLTGDICLERWELQGIFTNVCAYYWSKDCQLSFTVLLKKYKGYEALIQELIDLDIFKTDGDYLSIHFLNEQWASKETQKMVNAINGKLGGRPKKDKTEIKPNGLFFDNQTNNQNQTNIEKSIVKESKEEESKEDDFAFDSDFENKKEELINLLVDVWGFSEQKYSQQKSMVYAFVTTQLKSIEDINHFAEQYKNYDEYKKLSGEQRHNSTGYFGTQAMKFQNAAWNSENWALKLQNYKANNKSTTKFERTAEAYKGADNPYK